MLNTNLKRENPSLLKTSKNCYATCVSLVRALLVDLTGNIFINSIVPMRVTGCPHPQKKMSPAFLAAPRQKIKNYQIQLFTSSPL